MWYILIGIALLGAFLWLCKEYGFKTATISVVVSGGLTASMIWLAFTFFMSGMNQLSDWHRVVFNDSHVKVSRLEYEPDLGLIALTEDGTVKVTDKIPTCSPEGEIAINLSSDTYAELTQTPRLKVAIPNDKNVVQRLTFDIVYPIGADELGVSSFILDKDGHIWCAELYARGGLAGGSAFAVGFVFLAMFTSPFVVLVFLWSLAGTIWVMGKLENSKPE